MFVAFLSFVFLCVCVFFLFCSLILTCTAYLMRCISNSCLHNSLCKYMMDASNKSIVRSE